MLVLGLMAALWGLGWAFGLPSRLRAQTVILLWAAAILAHLILPEGSPLRQMIGGSAASWLVLGGVAVLVLAYRAVLQRLRARAAPEVVPESGPFRQAELTRYARHILLREIGGPGQLRLKEAKVLVVGAGGLGSPAVLYLAAAGVGTIGLIDGDMVEASNLQRQIIHTQDRIGQPKVQSAYQAVQALNPFVTLRPYNRRLTDEIARDLIASYDLVLDGTDNFDTRYLVNRTCVALGKPLISGAMTQWEGQVSLYHPAAGAPCFQCVFPERPAPGMVPTCAEAGVVAPLPGIIGSIMATEAVKHLTGAGETLAGRLMIHDALYAENRVIGVKRRVDCPVCGGEHR
jgi:molybdopterin/thiamine biosynthesis adenylyltransferase